MTELTRDQVNREEKVEVFCDERIFSGWESVDIEAALDHGRSFRLAISGEVADTIPVESEIAVEIAGERVVSGYIDGVGGAVGNKQHTTTLVGRSKVGQLVDCSAVPTTFTNATVLHIAQRLAAPHGVEVVSDLASETTSFRVQPGEFVWESIEKLVRGKFVILTDDAQGRMNMTRAGAAGDDGNVRPLIYGENILGRSYNLDWSKRYKTYKVHGQGTSKGDVFHRQTGIVTDDAVRLNRTLLLVGGAQQPGITAQTRASYEQRTRLGQSISYTATVQGWRDAQGDLWRPNTMVAIWDPFLVWEGVYLLVTAVKFSISSDGATTTQLECHPRQGYEMPEQTMGRRRQGVQRKRFTASLLGIGPLKLGANYDRWASQNEKSRLVAISRTLGLPEKQRLGWLAQWQQKDLE